MRIIKYYLIKSIDFQFNPGLKKIGVTREFHRGGETNVYFTSFHSGVEIYLQGFAAYFTKFFYGKSTFRMQLQDYIKTILHFINKRRGRKITTRKTVPWKIVPNEFPTGLWLGLG